MVPKERPPFAGVLWPLTAITGLLAIAAAAASLWEGHPARWFVLAAAIIVLAVVSTFYIYFQKANARFSAASLSVEKVPEELRRWATWHW